MNSMRSMTAAASFLSFRISSSPLIAISSWIPVRLRSLISTSSFASSLSVLPIRDEFGSSSGSDVSCMSSAWIGSSVAGFGGSLKRSRCARRSHTSDFAWYQQDRDNALSSRSWHCSRRNMGTLFREIFRVYPNDIKMKRQITVFCSIFVIRFQCNFLCTLVHTCMLLTSLLWDVFPIFTNRQGVIGRGLGDVSWSLEFGILHWNSTWHSWMGSQTSPHWNESKKTIM